MIYKNKNNINRKFYKAYPVGITQSQSAEQYKICKHNKNNKTDIIIKGCKCTEHERHPS